MAFTQVRENFFIAQLHELPYVPPSDTPPRIVRHMAIRFLVECLEHLGLNVLVRSSLFEKAMSPHHYQRPRIEDHPQWMTTLRHDVSEGLAQGDFVQVTLYENTLGIQKLTYDTLNFHKNLQIEVVEVRHERNQLMGWQEWQASYITSWDGLLTVLLDKITQRANQHRLPDYLEDMRDRLERETYLELTVVINTLYHRLESVLKRYGELVFHYPRGGLIYLVVTPWTPDETSLFHPPQGALS